jgi:hypothetical protein
MIKLNYKEKQKKNGKEKQDILKQIDNRLMLKLYQTLDGFVLFCLTVEGLAITLHS